MSPVVDIKPQQPVPWIPQIRNPEPKTVSTPKPKPWTLDSPNPMQPFMPNQTTYESLTGFLSHQQPPVDKPHKPQYYSASETQKKSSKPPNKPLTHPIIPQTHPDLPIAKS